MNIKLFNRTKFVEKEKIEDDKIFVPLLFMLTIHRGCVIPALWVRNNYFTSFIECQERLFRIFDDMVLKVDMLGRKVISGLTFRMAEFPGIKRFNVI